MSVAATTKALTAMKKKAPVAKKKSVAKPEKAAAKPKKMESERIHAEIKKTFPSVRHFNLLVKFAPKARGTAKINREIAKYIVSFAASPSADLTAAARYEIDRVRSEHNLDSEEWACAGFCVIDAEIGH